MARSFVTALELFEARHGGVPCRPGRGMSRSAAPGTPSNIEHGTSSRADAALDEVRKYLDEARPIKPGGGGGAGAGMPAEDQRGAVRTSLVKYEVKPQSDR